MWQCPKCKSNNNDEDRFCGVCGGPRPVPAPAGGIRFCGGCGAKLIPGQAFCPQCGQRAGSGASPDSGGGHRGETGGGSKPPGKQGWRKFAPLLGALAFLAIALVFAYVILPLIKGTVSVQIAGHEYSRDEIREAAEETELSEKELEEALETYTLAGKRIEEILGDVDTDGLEDDDDYEDTAEDIISQLKKCEYINKKSIEYDEASKSIVFEYSCGGQGIICLEEKNSDFDGPGACSSGYAEEQPEVLAELLPAEAAAPPLSGPSQDGFPLKVLMLRSYSRSDSEIRESRLKSSVLTNNVRLTRIDNADIPDFMDLSGYDIVMIFMHGTYTGGESYMAVAREYSSKEQMRALYGAYERNGYVAIFYGIDRETGEFVYQYCIRENYLQMYPKKALDNCVVLVSCCMFFGADEYSTAVDNDFADAFIRHGAECVVGFHNSVMSYYNMDLFSEIERCLNNGDSAQYGLDSAKQRFGPNDYNYRSSPSRKEFIAYPVLRGDGSFRFDSPASPVPDPDPGPSTEPQPILPIEPEPAEVDYYDLYHRFVSSYSWNTMLRDWGYTDIYPIINGQGFGDYYIYDIDNDGIPELIMNGGVSMAESFTAVFSVTADGSTIYPILCDDTGCDLGIGVIPEDGLLMTYEYHGGAEYTRYYLIEDKTWTGAWAEERAPSGPFIDVSDGGKWSFSIDN